MEWSWASWYRRLEGYLIGKTEAFSEDSSFSHLTTPIVGTKHWIGYFPHPIQCSADYVTMVDSSIQLQGDASSFRWLLSLPIEWAARPWGLGFMCGWGVCKGLGRVRGKSLEAAVLLKWPWKLGPPFLGESRSCRRIVNIAELSTNLRIPLRLHLDEI